MFVCRACGTAMEEIRRASVRLWRCPGCGSVVLTEIALRRLVARAAWTRLWPALRAGGAEGRKRCPGCAREMRESPPLEPDLPVRVDGCPHCRLVWLDPSELEQLPQPARPAQEPQPLAREAREQEALRKVERMRERWDAEEREERALALQTLAWAAPHWALALLFALLLQLLDRDQARRRTR